MPSDPNDRLLLGLKGTMSEVELHTMRQRLERGRLHKAQRGAMFHGVPMGYVLLATGDVNKDPDGQAQAVIQLLFEQFETLGSLYGLFHYLVRHHIWLPVRARTGPQKGQWQWRRPSLATLGQVLHHPIYAGAYAYGRRPVGSAGAYTGHPAHRRKWCPDGAMGRADAGSSPRLYHLGALPQNQERLKQNQSAPDTRGRPARRGGPAGGGLRLRHVRPPDACVVSADPPALLYLFAALRGGDRADLSWGPSHCAAIPAWRSRSCGR